LLDNLYPEQESVSVPQRINEQNAEHSHRDDQHRSSCPVARPESSNRRGNCREAQQAGNDYHRVKTRTLPIAPT
jgi:hypothetical protein